MRSAVPKEQVLQPSLEAVAAAESGTHARMPFMPKAGSSQQPLRSSSARPMVSPQACAPGSNHPLAPWLNWLDGRLRLALGVMRNMVGEESMGDSYRGLYITPNEVDRLLAQAPGRPLFAGLGAATFPAAPLPAGFSRLAAATGLTPFDIAAVLIAAAPEIDLRYERLYAFLQDDVSRKRPSVDLALNLLCGSTDEKLQMRARFMPSAPLLRYGLLQLLPDSSQAAPPLALHALKPDNQVLAALLGDTGIDERLGACAHVHVSMPAAAAPLDKAPHRDSAFGALSRIAAQALAGAAPLRCYLHGPDALALEAAADTLADSIQQAAVHLDLALLKDLSRSQPAHERLFSSTLDAAFRHAWLQGAILCFDRVDALCDADNIANLRVLLDRLNHPAAVCMLTGAKARSFEGAAGNALLSVAFPALTRGERQHAWHTQLERHGLPGETAAMLASRFQLSTGQTGNAVRAAGNQMRLAPDTHAGTEELENLLFAAARLQTRHVFAGLAQLIEPKRSWADLILPDDALAQLHEISSRFLHQDQVLEEWGFAHKLGYGTGTTVLFAGPSGTGKTMAAEVLAHALGLDLYRIDLAGIVSKYIGETEKNLDRLFSAADQANAVLFFDEADALFGKRTEVKDSHDRYANLEVSYLLQKMEQYQGIAILASNLRQNLDDAFVRRLAFIVHFPFPDEMQRRRIWETVWPADVRLGDDLDREELARDLKFSGGNIKNVALAAAFLAAKSGSVIRREHIHGAAEREFQKLGRPNPMARSIRCGEGA